MSNSAVEPAHASVDRCKLLLEHVIALEFQKATGSATTDIQRADLAKQRTAVEAAKSAEFLDVCTHKTDPSRVECALAATDLDGVARCDGN